MPRIELDYNMQSLIKSHENELLVNILRPNVLVVQEEQLQSFNYTLLFYAFRYNFVLTQLYSVIQKYIVLCNVLTLKLN